MSVAIRQVKDSSSSSPYLKNQLSAKSRDLSALLALAEVATQSLDIEKTLNDTLDKSLEILGFEVGFIRILDQTGTGMAVRAARGLRSPEFLQGIAPIQSERRNVSRIVFETKEPYVCADIRKNPVYSNRTLEREGVISTAAAPVLSKSRVLGLIVVGSRKHHRFAKREINLLKAFGAQLGAALENDQLYDEVAKGKAYVENLVDNAADVIVCTDLEDKILTWNRGAEVIFGYGKGEILGKSLSILLPPERAHELEETRAKVQFSGPLRDIEVQSRRKDGALLHLSLSISPIKDSEDKVIGFLRVAKDISDKKRFERRLKELDRMKSDFVSNVSHELRTPLTAIKGSVDNMLDGITGPLGEKQIRYLERIKANADRLGRLITDLLDLSKIEAGKIELHPQRLGADLLVKEVAEVLRGVAAEKLITLDVVSPPDPVQIWADRDKVVQILMNLVGNAIKFTPRSGEVKVAIDRSNSDWVKLSVIDTGPGIPAEEAAKIFDKFYQIARPNDSKTKGTGLGLAITRALVEMHGGRVWIEAANNGGSVFSFTLPARQPLESEPASE
jgi:PAS domain S-box-containing protein